MTNYWIVAPHGYGKTKYVIERWGSFCIYNKYPNKWWDGYTDQSIVLCDNYGPKECRDSCIWKWSNGLPIEAIMKGRKKGDMIKPKHIIVTSIYDVEYCLINIFKINFEVIDLVRFNK